MYLENWIEESKATERAALLKEGARHKVKASSKVENFLKGKYNFVEANFC